MKETILHCPHCNTSYSSEVLSSLIQPWCKFGYDVVVYVGKAAFLHCRNVEEIVHKLKERNISISPSEVSHLAKKFVAFLSLAHRDSSKQIKKFMSFRGGYILHLDGTCDGGSPHLMSGLDGISEIVLANVKLPSEKKEQIIPFLEKIGQQYGNPLALVHDMGKGILYAIEKVFPDAPDFICHFHFLRDTGKDLLEKEYAQIRKLLRKHNIRSLLRKKANLFKKVVDRNPELIDSLKKGVENQELMQSSLERVPVVAAYLLILWALNANQRSNGYGFPFDRPHVEFYERLKVIHSVCHDLKGIYLRKRWEDNAPFHQLYNSLDKVVKDATLKRALKKIQQKITIFDKLRHAMRIAPPDQNKGLNDDGMDAQMSTIEQNVTRFRNWVCNDELLSRDRNYQKMIAQIDKYWEKLFADPIPVVTPAGKVLIQPQRTNNILERLFRDLRRNNRRKSGINSLNRVLRSILADTPLVKNLENEDYMKILLNGKENLQSRFAEIEAKLLREELNKTKQEIGNVCPKTKKIIRRPNLPQTLATLFKSYVQT